MTQVAKAAMTGAGTARRAAPRRRAVAVAALVAVLAPVCFVTPAPAQEAVALSGELFVAGRTAIDPPAREPKNSHAYFTVEGDAARRMFTSMRSKEEKDLCRGEGWKLKRAGNLYCSVAANGKDAACDFSVDIGAGKALLDEAGRSVGRVARGCKQDIIAQPGCSPRRPAPHPQ
jgi:hypothetical protein